MYYYDVASPDSNLIQTYEHRAPVLDACFGDNENEAFTAGMDWTVNKCDKPAVELGSPRANY